MPDPYASHASSLDAPAFSAFAITPADGADLASTVRCIYVGGYGDLSVILAGDTSPVTFVNVQPGTLLPARARRVRSTGTTATNLVGML